MDVTRMLEELNREIERLTQIRDLLGVPAAAAKPGPGRPKGSGKQPAEAMPKRRILSAEARERIAAAQRKRWAAGKQASKSTSAGAKPKPVAAKKAVKSLQSTKKTSPPVNKKATAKKQLASPAPVEAAPTGE